MALTLLDFDAVQKGGVHPIALPGHLAEWRIASRIRLTR